MKKKVGYSYPPLKRAQIKCVVCKRSMKFLYTEGQKPPECCGFTMVVDVTDKKC